MVKQHAVAIVLVATLPLLQSCLAGSQHQHHMQSKRQGVWSKVLNKPSRAVAIAIDNSGVLWRARVRQGHILLSRSVDEITFGDEVKVNQVSETVAANGENRPKLGFGAAGEIFVSWTRLGKAPFSGDIRFSRSLDAGKHFSIPITINSHTETTSHRFESMVIDDKNRIWLFWLDKRDKLLAKQQNKPYSGAAVYYIYSEDAGRSFSDNFKLQDHSCQCCRIALGVTSQSVPVVVWRHIFDGGERDHALQFVDGKSVMKRLSKEHWKINACPHHGPSLAIDKADGVHAVWFSGAKNRTGLYYSHSKRKGNAVHSSAPMKFGDHKAQSSHPYVSLIGNNVFIVWKEFRQGKSVVRSIHSLDLGRSWSRPRTLLSTGGPSDHPLLVGNDKKLYLAWNTDKQGLQILQLNPSK